MKKKKIDSVYVIAMEIYRVYKKNKLRKTFRKNEFKDQEALNILLKALRELQFVQEDKYSFTINHLGMNYIKKIISKYDKINDYQMFWMFLAFIILVLLITSKKLIFIPIIMIRNFHNYFSRGHDKKL